MFPYVCISHTDKWDLFARIHDAILNHSNKRFNKHNTEDVIWYINNPFVLVTTFYKFKRVVFFLIEHLKSE